MPKNFGKTALGAVHSNYKTEPCKNWTKTGECKFGEGCSFFHDGAERRKLIDPLPNLPDGVTLPPMPEKLKNYQAKKQSGYFQQRDHQGDNGQYNPMQYQPQMNQGPVIQISSLTDIVALGGFNPNKYMSPQPMPFAPMGYGQVPPHMMQQPQPQFGQPAPFQNGGQSAQSPSKPKSKKDKKASQEKKVKPVAAENN